MALPDTTVCYYDSTMSGAPALSGTAGTLIAVLDACLVNGFGSKTLDSLVVTDNVATGTVGAGHNLALVGGVGPVIEIAGATPGALNGKWRVASVPGSTTFTFATEGISNQTATGTITAKRAALDWAKTYSGTNKAAYRPNDVTSSRLYLRVDDTGSGAANYARARGYETMSDVDTGTGPFPTDAQLSGGLYVAKSSTTDGAARAWRIIGDPLGFALLVLRDGTNWIGHWFGDLVSAKPGDAYHFLTCACTNSSTVNGGLPTFNSVTGHYMARSYAQTGGSIQVIKLSHRLATLGMGYTSDGLLPYPNSADNRFYATPVHVFEGTAETNTIPLRGLFPGIYAPLHKATNFSDASTQTDIDELPGKTLFLQKVYSGANYFAAIDLTGPWR